MKQIRLVTLTLDHFKGIFGLSLDFGGKSAALYGANGVGKSTIYDAWLWLVTGKDSAGMVPDDNKGFCIKPLDENGTVADRAAHSVVTASINVDGSPVTLRREYYERWTRKRGAAEASYDGNATGYYINEVPRTKREFEDYLNQIVPMDTWHLLSHTGAFAAMADADRRSILFDMAGIGAERDMMAREERFAPLLAATETITLPEYQRQIAAARKNCNKELNILPARLDEVGRTVTGLRNIPFAQIRESAAELQEQLDQLQREISAAQDHSGLDRLRSEGERLRAELSALEADNRAHRAKQEAKQPSPEAVRRELALLKMSLEDANAQLRREQKDADRCEKEAEKRREQYRALKVERYAGSGTCPTCGQPMPKERQQAARERWEQDRQKRLDTIAEEGKFHVKTAMGYRQREQEARERVSQIEDQIDEKTKYLELLEATVPLEIDDLPEYQQQREALLGRIADNERARQEASAGQQDRQAPLMEQRRALMDELTALNKQAAREAQLMDAQARERELKQQQRRMAEELERADRAVDLIEQFTRYKAEFVTDTINALFRLARFRLFRQQVNGGVVDCCDILCGGVDFHRGLNTGAKVRCGLDMIATLSRHFGVSVPVFVDNAESVTGLDTGEGQVIRLIVSENDFEMRCEVC